MRRPSLLITLIVVIAVATTMGSALADGPDQLPDVSSWSMTPQELPADGGSVTIQATATDDHSVTDVSAAIDDDIGSEWVVDLGGTGADTYEGTWDAPANSATAAHVYTVTLTATDDSEQQRFVNAGQITVDGVPPPTGDDEPPVIDSATVSPQSLSSDGGVVDVLVQAHDDRGVDGVHVDLSGPGVTLRSVPVPNSGGEMYSTSIQLPSNAGQTPATYPFTVVVVDSAGQTTSYPTTDVTVDPPSGGTPSAPPSGGDPTASPTSSATPVTTGPEVSRLGLSRHVVRMRLHRPGARALATVRLRNLGRGIVTGHLSGLGSPFRVVRGADPVSIAPGRTLTVVIAFRPRRPGRYAGRLRFVRDDGLQAGRLGVRLVGTLR